MVMYTYSEVDRLLTQGAISGHRFPTHTPFNRPTGMFGERFTDAKAVAELLQNAVDEAVRTGTRVDISKLDDVTWRVQDYGAGFSSANLRALISEKPQDRHEEVGEGGVITVGINGTGSKKAGAKLMASGAELSFRSRRWVAKTTGFELLSDELVPYATVLGIDAIVKLDEELEGTAITMKNLSAEAQAVLERPDEWFLFFKEQDHGWQPRYVSAGKTWTERGIDSIVAAEPGAVWLQGARVTEEYKDKMLFTYNFNTIRAPDDDDRTVVNWDRVDRALDKFYTTCDDEGIIDMVIQAGVVDDVEFAGTEMAEWTSLSYVARKKRIQDGVRTRYRKRFNELFAGPSGRVPVMQAPESRRRDMSSKRVERTLDKLGLERVKLHPKLAEGLHACGVQYDCDFTVSFQQLLDLPASEFPTDGSRVRHVDDMNIRSGVRQNRMTTEQSMYGLLWYHQELTGASISPRIQFLVDTGDTEVWVDVEDYHREVAIPLGLPRRAGGETLTPKKDHVLFEMADLDPLHQSKYFAPVQTVRFVMDYEGGLDLRDIGEAYNAEAVDEARADKTDAQEQTASLLTRLCVGAIHDKRSIAIRSKDFHAIPKRRTQRGKARNYLDAIIGLREDEDLQDAVAVSFMPKTGEKADTLKTLIDLPKNVLSFRKYTPIGRDHFENELIALGGGRHQYLRGFRTEISPFGGGFLFQYNFVKEDPTTSPDESRLTNIARNAIIDINNKEVYKAIFREAARSPYASEDSEAELCDLLEVAEKARYASTDHLKAEMRIAFEELFGEDGKEAVISTKRDEPEQHGARHINFAGSDVRYIVDTSGLGENAQYHDAAEQLGYKVVEVHPSVAKMLKKCGIKDDIGAVATGCTYKVVDGYQGIMPNGTSTIGKMVVGYDLNGTQKETLSKTERLAEMLAQATGEQYEIVPYEGLQKITGDSLSGIFRYAKVKSMYEGRDMNTIFVHVNELDNERQAIESIIDVAVDQKTGVAIAKDALYQRLGATRMFGWLITKAR